MRFVRIVITKRQHSALLISSSSFPPSLSKELVAFLGQHSPIPCTYAGGGRSLEDLQRVQELSQGRIDLTFGSALDIFGGKGVKFDDCVAWNQQQQQQTAAKAAAAAETPPKK